MPLDVCAQIRKLHGNFPESQILHSLKISRAQYYKVIEVEHPASPAFVSLLPSEETIPPNQAALPYQKILCELTLQNFTLRIFDI